MELCRLITLSKEHNLLYAIEPLPLDEQAAREVLVGPIRLAFDGFGLAAQLAPDASLCCDVTFTEQIVVTWSLVIVDDSERQPLFKGRSPGQALLLIGDVVTSLCEGLQKLSHRLVSVTVDAATDCLVVTYVVPQETDPRAVVGAAMCLVAMVEALLFARGLMVSSATVAMPMPMGLPQCDLFDVYRRILMMTRDHP